VVLGFLSTTDVGRPVPALVEEDAQCEVSEWELRERREREGEWRLEAEELGDQGEEQAAVPPYALLHWPLRKRSRAAGSGFPLSFLCISILCHFLGALYIFLGQARTEGKGEHLQADRGWGRTVDSLFIAMI
jgi:hypothetical protein